MSDGSLVQPKFLFAFHVMSKSVQHKAYETYGPHKSLSRVTLFILCELLISYISY